MSAGAGNIEWRVGDVTATTVYHDMFVGGELRPNCWIAEFAVDKPRMYQFVFVGDASGAQHRLPMRDTFDEAKADAAMHFAEIELERP